MAKLIEVVKKRESNAVAGTIAFPQKREPIDECEPILDQEIEPVFSFIELDGASRSIEGSPDVLSRPVPFAKSAPVTEAQTPPPKIETAQENFQEPSVAYHPWSGSAPAHTGKVSTELLVYHQPDHPVSRQYFGLLDKLLEKIALPQVLLLPCSIPDSAASLLVLSLAIAGSRLKNQKVALLEMTSDKSQVAAYLGIEPVLDLRQVLEGKIALEQSLQSSPVANLFLLTNNECNFPQEEYWNRDALGWIISWLRNRFDLTLIQVTDWTATPPQQILASLCDSVHPVLPANKEGEKEGARMLHSLAAQGARIRGVINFRAQN